LAAVGAGCTAHTLDLGGNTDAGPSTDAGADAPTGPWVPTTMRITTCANPSDMSATLGDGFNGIFPAECMAPHGAAHAVTGSADMAAALVGMWFTCDKPFGIDMGNNVDAVQLTADGHYAAYGAYGGPDNMPQLGNDNLVPIGQLGTSTASSTGTFTVVDGSAKYGPGTYELQLHPDGGGLFLGQALLTDGPRQLRFLPLNSAGNLFTPALSWSPRKGVCSCIDTTQTASFETDAASLASAIVGRWMWCGGPGGAAGGIGIEFAAGNTWYALNEDVTGALTRGAGALDHGTYTIVATSQGGAAMGPEPLSIMLGMAHQAEGTQLLLFSNPRTLLLSGGTTSHLDDAGVATIVNIYSTFLPIP
jgi:hypothetical protein